MSARAVDRDPGTPGRKRRAIVTGLVLAAIALAIYATVIVQYVAGR
jgi:hypothetical protein